MPCIDLRQFSSDNQNKNLQCTNSDSTNIILQDISNEQINNNQVSVEKNVSSFDGISDTLNSTTSNIKQVLSTETINKKSNNCKQEHLGKSKHKLFTNLIKKLNNLNLPNRCFVNVPDNKNTIIIYELYLDPCNEHMDFSECSIKRSIIVKRDMKIIYSAFNKNISPQVIQLLDKLKSFKELQSIINFFLECHFAVEFLILRLEIQIILLP